MGAREWGFSVWAHNQYVGDYQHITDALSEGKAGGRGSGETAKQVHHVNQDAIYGLEHGVPNGIPYKDGVAIPLEGRTSTRGGEHRAFHVSMDTWLSQYMPGGDFAGTLPTNGEYHQAVIRALDATGSFNPREIFEIADAAQRQRIKFGFLDNQEIPQLPQRAPLGNKPW